MIVCLEIVSIIFAHVKKRFIGILILLGTYGCMSKDLIPEEKMETILYKFSECEAYTDLKQMGKDSAFLKACYADVLASEGVSSELFEFTMGYYQTHSIELEAIYDSILKKKKIAPDPKQAM